MKTQARAILLLALVLSLAAVAYAGTRGTLELKAGDEIHACDCGEKCACLSLSRNPGKCTCGKEMVKAKVVKAEGGMVTLKAASWEKERPFKAAGKYTCACPPSCTCDSIGQNPGNCTCGKEMKKTEM